MKQTTITELLASIRAAQSKWGGDDNSAIRFVCQPEGDNFLYARWDDSAHAYIIRSYGS